MTAITAKQEEWAARLLCRLMGMDPDGKAELVSDFMNDDEDDPLWYRWREYGRELLAELERQKVNVTPQPFECPCHEEDPNPCPLCGADPDKDACRLDYMARCLPICPEAD